MFGCDEIRERLHSYAVGECDERTARLTEAHLAICADCAGELKRIREVLRLTDALPRVRASHDLYPAVATRIRPRPLRRRLIPAAAAAAAVVIALLLYPSAPPKVRRGPAKRRAAAEKDKGERPAGTAEKRGSRPESERRLVETPERKPEVVRKPPEGPRREERTPEVRGPAEEPQREEPRQEEARKPEPEPEQSPERKPEVVRKPPEGPRREERTPVVRGPAEEPQREEPRQEEARKPGPGPEQSPKPADEPEGPARPEVLAKVGSVSGALKVERPGSEKPLEAGPLFSVMPGDTLLTGSTGRARLDMEGGDHVYLNSGARVTISKDKEDEVVFHLEKGEIYLEKESAQGAVAVETGFGRVRSGKGRFGLKKSRASDCLLSVVSGEVECRERTKGYTARYGGPTRAWFRRGRRCGRGQRLRSPDAFGWAAGMRPPAGRRPPRRPPHPPAPAEKMLKRFDTDGDGRLSLEELKELRKKMMERRRECPPNAGRPGPHGPGPGGPPPPTPLSPKEMLKRFDTDGDGGLSLEELQEMLREMKERAGGGRPGDRRGRPGGRHGPPAPPQRPGPGGHGPGPGPKNGCGRHGGRGR